MSMVGGNNLCCLASLSVIAKQFPEVGRMAKQSLSGIVQPFRATPLPLGGDVPGVPGCFKTVYHFLKWQISGAGQTWFPSISVFPTVPDVLEMHMDCFGPDQVPCFGNRFPQPIGMSKVPNDANARMIGKVENFPNSLARRKGIMRFDCDLDAMLVACVGYLPERFGHPSVCFIVAGSGLVSSSKNTNDRCFPGFGKLNKLDRAVYCVVSI